MTGRELIDQLREVGSVQHTFRFPYVYVRVVNDIFSGLDDEMREKKALDILKVPSSELRRTAANCMFTIEWMTTEESKGSPAESRGDHWLRAFLEPTKPLSLLEQAKNGVRVAHFFGYKGGQGRSTVLACLAQRLANEGAKILVLDADIEAPSLDTIFGVAPIGLSSTLLGIARGANPIKPVSALRGRDQGAVHMLACRPREPLYDIDFAAFALQTSLMPSILSQTATRIRDWALREEYHAVLVDHRSGMATTTLAWMMALPGPCVVFSKLDEQWRGAESVFKEVFEANPSNPGVIVSFKPDEEDEDQFRRRTLRQRNDLLSVLVEVTATGAHYQAGEQDAEFLVEPSDLEDHWLLWPYDQCFRTINLPDLSSLGSHTRETLAELTGLLDLQVEPKKKLSPIGSVDQGDLIETDALQKLLQPNNPFAYIFGRKGTGKTRIAAELALRKQAEPLLVDAASTAAYGVKTSDTEFEAAREAFKHSPESLWWSVLLAALQGVDTKSDDMRVRLSSILQLGETQSWLRQKVIQNLPMSNTRVFLIDGIETAFSSSEVYCYVEHLFRFMLAIQSDSQLNERVRIKLFLRTDLKAQGIQNLEQQIDGRLINLYWDYERILNFMLSRLPARSFFDTYFSETIQEIRRILPEVKAGEVSAEKSESILLEIFPRKLRRSNIQMTTFLRLHFADSSGSGPTYYPRVIDKFLETIDNEGRSHAENALDEGRVQQKLIIKAHEQAADDYMQQIQQELRFLIEFGQSSATDNQKYLAQWLNLFAGQKTPFEVTEMETFLTSRMNLDSGIARRCLGQMLSIGIFEKTEDNPNVWRAGRLFKSSLKMKYKRV